MEKCVCLFNFISLQLLKLSVRLGLKLLQMPLDT